MNRVFIELYLDEDVNVVIRDLISASGFDVVTARDAGQAGRSDLQQLAYAARDGRTIVSHNRVHFESLASEYFATGQRHAGIIIAVQRPPQQVAQRLLAILNHVTADEIENQIRYI